MTMQEFGELYSSMCAAYGKEENQAQKMEYFASLKDWSFYRARQVFDEIKGGYDWFPKISEFKKVYAIIRENELREKLPKAKVYNTAPNQDEVNERGILLVMFQLYQNSKGGRAFGIKTGELRTAIKRLHKRGYWTHWSKTLPSDYPNKSKIDELAQKEINQAV